MFDRLREYVNEKLGRGEPWEPQPTTVDHGTLYPAREIEGGSIRAESFGQGSSGVPTPVVPDGSTSTLVSGGALRTDPTTGRLRVQNRFWVPNPVATILDYAARIRNDRTEMTILRHARDDEMVELEDEVEAWNSGAGNTDRVIAEAMDVVGCMIDLVHYVRPGITLNELDEVTKTLCERWATKYAESAGKPEGTDALARRSR